jgi:lipid II:glycine glycyltransferase (peptidoglycan interpeptide bridge formation enzyme)
MLNETTMPAPALSAAAGYRVTVDSATHDPAWDAFVAITPGGHHAQTSLWAQVKAVLGWEATRIVVHEGDTIVGGAQFLTRAIGPAGRVGFAPRGPLLASADPKLLDEVQRAMMAFGREQRVRYLKVQPPTDRHDLVDALRVRGWAPSAMEAAPTADVRVDLTVDEDAILARMRSRTRNYIRQAERRGLEIRSGTEDDLAAFYAVVEATSRRQGFAAYPQRYYETMWRVFGVQAELLLAELDGQLLCSTIVLGYGDSATYKMGGWTGEKTRVHPSEAIQFAGMRWAKGRGFRYYDFDGVHKSVALALQSNGELSEEERHGVAAFKLQFGGDVVLHPGALDSSPSRLLRPAVRAAAPRIDRLQRVAHRALGRG